MSYRADWTPAAKCKGLQDVLFVEGPDQRKVSQFCHGCPVRRECLAEALDGQMEYGVWGGMTERERRALLRQRPDVASWYAVLVEQPHPPALTPRELATEPVRSGAGGVRRRNG